MSVLSSQNGERFISLSKEDIKKYRDEFSSYPAINHKEKVEKAINDYNIPIEYLVDTEIIKYNDFLYVYEISTDKLQYILDYLTYKKIKIAPEAVKNICVVTSKEEIYNRVEEIVKNMNDEGIHITKDVHKCTGVPALFIASNDTEDKVLNVINTNNGIVIYVGSCDCTGIYCVDELNEDVFNEIKKGNLSIFANKNDTERQLKENINKNDTERQLNGDINKEELEVSNTEENSKENLAKTDDIQLESLQDLEEPKIILTESQLNAKLKNVKDTLNAKLKNVEDKLNKEIKKLTELLQIKEESIELLEQRIYSYEEQAKKAVETIKNLKKEIQKLNINLTDEINKNNEIKKYKDLYLSIIDEYNELKEYKQNTDNKIEELKDYYELKIEEYKKLKERAEQANKELERNFDDFYVTDSSDKTFSIHINKPVIYYKILGEPKYFYSMLRYLYMVLKVKYKKVLTIAFKNINDFDYSWEDWWQTTEDVSYIEKYDNKLLLQKLNYDNKNLLEGLITEYNVILVIDYLMNKTDFIIGDKVFKYNVVRDKKHAEVLNVDGDIISEDEGVLKYSEDMSKYTNKKVKMAFYEERLSELLHKIEG